MTIKLFANYGVLAHEHTPQYNYNSNGVSDAVSVTVPDKYSPAERLLYGIPYGYSVTLHINGGTVDFDLCDALNQDPAFRRACTIVKDCR